MSNNVFPTLPGLSIEYTRTPVWSTTRKTSVSLREFRTANASYPRYKLKLKFEVLRNTIGFTEFTTLVGFYNARQGGFDSFLWTDPDDNAVTAQSIGSGNGSNKIFQLARTFGGFVEPVYDVNGAISVYVNGVLKTLTTDYSISSTGLITFVTAPPNGQAVTWTGSFYRRMVFLSDTLDFAQMLNDLWTVASLEMISVKP